MRRVALAECARWLLAAGSVLGACSAPYRPATLRAALDEHDLVAARRLLDTPLTPREGRPASDGHAGLLFLERASVRMAAGDFAGCAADFGTADRLLDRQALSRARFLRDGYNPETTQYMFERGWAQAGNLPYGAKFYERLLLNPLAALCRLENDDPRGACVEARRFGVISEWTEHVAPGRARDVRAFGELIAGIACSDVAPVVACESVARARAYDEAIDDASLTQICGARSASGRHGDRARLFVLVGYGRPSRPLEPRPDGGGGRTSVDITGGVEIRGEIVALRVDDHELAAPSVLDVERAVRDDFEESQHAITVHFLGMSGETGSWSPEAWETLPAHLHLGVAELEPGTHEIQVQVRNATLTRQVELPADTSRLALFFSPW